MMRWRAGLIAVCFGLGSCERVPVDALGVYRLDDGRLLSLRESRDDALRITIFETGETRRLIQGEGAWTVAEETGDDALTGVSVELVPDALEMRWGDSERSTAARVLLDEREERVTSGDIALHVRLSLPVGELSVPVVVLVHGSSDEAATRFYQHGDFFVANGIGVAVFDKRGTGRSGGVYGYDFDVLANDVSAVVDWVARQPGVDATHVGLSGYSQGGWIAPLAASRSDKVAFVLVSYGMIDSPAEQERLQTRNLVARRGFSGADLDKVDEVTLASIRVLETNFESAWQELDAVVARYDGEPWFHALTGTAFAELTAWPHWLVRTVGPWVTPTGLPWRYNSLAALDTLASRGIPSVWMIAGEDRSAPNGLTLEEVRRRAAVGEPVYLEVFPKTDHGIRKFTEEAGRRRYNNYHPDYFATQVEWAKRLSADGVPASEGALLAGETEASIARRKASP